MQAHCLGQLILIIEVPARSLGRHWIWHLEIASSRDKVAEGLFVAGLIGKSNRYLNSNCFMLPWKVLRNSLFQACLENKFKIIYSSFLPSAPAMGCSSMHYMYSMIWWMKEWVSEWDLSGSCLDLPPSYTHSSKTPVPTKGIDHRRHAIQYLLDKLISGWIFKNGS